jgi:hypothetical protein
MRDMHQAWRHTSYGHTNISASHLQGLDASASTQLLLQHKWIRPAATGIALVLAATFVWSVIKVVRRYYSPRSKRKRTVDLNKVDLISCKAVHIYGAAQHALLCLIGLQLSAVIGLHES